MLKILTGPTPNYLPRATKFFNFNYYPEWITDPEIVEIIRDIDKSEVVSGELIMSPVLGPIPPSSLSGGTKCLILIKFYEKNKTFLSTKFGNNCIPWLCRLSYEVDFEIYPRHCLGWVYYADTELNGVGMNGESLNTCREVWHYYMENQANICEM